MTNYKKYSLYNQTIYRRKLPNRRKMHKSEKKLKVILYNLI